MGVKLGAYFIVFITSNQWTIMCHNSISLYDMQYNCALVGCKETILPVVLYGCET